jgi:hypothetical protein
MITRILPIILILAAIGIFFGYVNPAYTKGVLPAEAKIKSYDNALKAAEDFNVKEHELAEKHNAIPPESIARLMAYLPDGVDNIQLILDLNALAAATGVRLSDFNVSSSDSVNPTQSSTDAALQSGSSPVEHLQISVKATATYSAFRAFLDGVEHSLRPMDLTQVTVSPSATGVYNYELTFRIYWLR